MRDLDVLPSEPFAREERSDRPDETVESGVVVGKVPALLQRQEMPAASQAKLAAQGVDDEVGGSEVPIRAGETERGDGDHYQVGICSGQTETRVCRRSARRTGR